MGKEYKCVKCGASFIDEYDDLKDGLNNRIWCDKCVDKEYKKFQEEQKEDVRITAFKRFKMLFGKKK